VPGGTASTIVEAYGPLPQPQRVLIPAPLYHTNGFTATRNLMGGDPIVLMERFNAERLLDLVERHRITGFIGATPMLQRIAAVEGVEHRDLSSLDWVQQGASPLPVWLGRTWCELVGPEHFYLSYGASEAHGLITCRGDEWLSHPGTLGRPALGSEIKILDAEQKVLPPGEVGSIYLRSPNGLGAFYVGRDVAPIPVTEDGFATVGDLGWLDDDGFVYLADRRSDMIVTGGVNVFPAEVESALSEHPELADVVVIGLSDPEWGKRVHAIVVATDQRHPPTVDSIVEFAKSRLAPYKVPKSVEFIHRLPRSDAMKLSRSALVAEREDAATPGGPV
jgi:bile acid-coenzyme A ligase